MLRRCSLINTLPMFLAWRGVAIDKCEKRAVVERIHSLVEVECTCNEIRRPVKCFR